MKENSFDAIVAYSIIHLLEDDKKVIRRIYELLKRDGIFISTTACMKDKMDFKSRMEVTMFILMKKIGIFPLHVNMYKFSDVKKLIEEHNFQIIETEKIKDGIPAIFVIARK